MSLSCGHIDCAEQMLNLDVLGNLSPALVASIIIGRTMNEVHHAERRSEGSRCLYLRMGGDTPFPDQICPSMHHPSVLHTSTSCVLRFHSVILLFESLEYHSLTTLLKACLLICTH